MGPPTLPLPWTTPPSLSEPSILSKHPISHRRPNNMNCSPSSQEPPPFPPPHLSSRLLACSCPTYQVSTGGGATLNVPCPPKAPQHCSGGPPYHTHCANFCHFPLPTGYLMKRIISPACFSLPAPLSLHLPSPASTFPISRDDQSPVFPLALLPSGH